MSKPNQDQSPQAQAAISPDALKALEQLPVLIQHISQQGEKKEGLVAYLKQTARDESNNPSSSRASMYIQLAMAGLAFLIGIVSLLGKDWATTLTLFGTAASFCFTAMRTNQAAQQKAAEITKARETTKQEELKQKAAELQQKVASNASPPAPASPPDHAASAIPPTETPQAPTPSKEAPAPSDTSS